MVATAQRSLKVEPRLCEFYSLLSKRLLPLQDSTFDFDDDDLLGKQSLTLNFGVLSFSGLSLNESEKLKGGFVMLDWLVVA